MRLLTAAGAMESRERHEADFSKEIAAAAGSVRKSAPMFSVPDMRATIRWYESIGFTVADRYEDGGELMFARVSFEAGEFTLSPGGDSGPRGVSLWFFTDRVEELYQLLRGRQLRVARASLAGGPGAEPDARRICMNPSMAGGSSASGTTTA
jgi:hypothetical protein